MKKPTIIVIVVLAALYLVFIRAFNLAEVYRPRVIHVKSTLLEAYVSKMLDIEFTNQRPSLCRIFEFTNYYEIGGTNYQCALAADTWDYQGASNLLAVTTNRLFLYIDRKGVLPVNHLPPGY